MYQIKSEYLNLFFIVIFLFLIFPILFRYYMQFFTVKSALNSIKPKQTLQNNSDPNQVKALDAFNPSLFFDLATVPIVVTNSSGTILESNEAFKNIFKFRNLQKSHLQNIFDYVLCDDLNKAKEQWAKLVYETKLQWEVKYQIDFEFSKNVQWHSVKVPESENVYCIGHDVTQIREHEARILSASKLISITQIAAGIAHEINNPLTIIRGRVELINRILAKENPDLQKIKNYLQNTDEMVSRAASIIDALRIFTLSSTSNEMQTGHLEEAWALPLMEKSFGLFKERFAKRKIRIEINLIGNDFKIYCRPREIIHVLNILIANSIEAIQKGVDPWISCHILKDAENVKIIFKDSGTGISNTHGSRIMEPFFSTKPHGSGLGLSIAKGLLTGHGGTLEFDPTQENTTFILKFPHSKKNSEFEIKRNVAS